MNTVIACIASALIGGAVGVALVKEKLAESLLAEQLVLRFQADNDTWLAEHQAAFAIAAAPDVTGELLAITSEPEPPLWTDEQRASFAAAAQSAIRAAYANRKHGPSGPYLPRHHAPEPVRRALSTSTQAMPVVQRDLVSA